MITKPIEFSNRSHKAWPPRCAWQSAVAEVDGRLKSYGGNNFVQSQEEKTSEGGLLRDFVCQDFGEFRTPLLWKHIKVLEQSTSAWKQSVLVVLQTFGYFGTLPIHHAKHRENPRLDESTLIHDDRWWFEAWTGVHQRQKLPSEPFQLVNFAMGCCS